MLIVQTYLGSRSAKDDFCLINKNLRENAVPLYSHLNFFSLHNLCMINDEHLGRYYQDILVIETRCQSER